MYLVVRKSLGMSPGKIGAQCGHIVEQLMDQFMTDSMMQVAGGADDEAVERIRLMSEWKRSGRTKIVVGADEKEWEKIQEIPFNVKVSVRDAGHTEVPTGTMTVIGFWPTHKETAPKILRRLRLLT
jgi:PTH2 family peptidyl-tRNA hydrolase